ncbi:MAG: sigma-54-dependent transcriptional regulator [Bacteroidales bacterium]
MSQILVIDDERSVRNTMKEILEFEGHSVFLAEDGIKGIEAANKNEPDIIFCDIKMPNVDGLEVLDKILQYNSDRRVIMISGHGTIDTAVDAIKRGAVDFIEKPIDLNRLLGAIKIADTRNAIPNPKKVKPLGNLSHVRKESCLDSKYEIIGSSKKLQKVLDMSDKVAPTEARVFITGDNGTGKELIARRIHAFSNRKREPFVEVNCAAIPSELIESELFGHEKGAFTSAVKQRKGKFEQANGGTLFLDEIGDMSLSAQAKVLRALQENEISRVGSDKSINVDVRIIAATNKDIQEEIEKGNFREDLYHRLSVILIKMPKLAERKDDIPILTNYFVDRISHELGVEPKEVTTGAIVALQNKAWTGNIRELRNVIERLIILSGEKIEEDAVKNFAPNVE